MEEILRKKVIIFKSALSIVVATVYRPFHNIWRNSFPSRQRYDPWHCMWTLLSDVRCPTACPNLHITLRAKVLSGVSRLTNIQGRFITNTLKQNFGHTTYRVVRVRHRVEWAHGHGEFIQDKEIGVVFGLDQPTQQLLCWGPVLKGDQKVASYCLRETVYRGNYQNRSKGKASTEARMKCIKLKRGKRQKLSKNIHLRENKKY